MQAGGFLPELRGEFEARSIDVVLLNTSADSAAWSTELRQELCVIELGPRDVVVALPSWVEVALEERGITGGWSGTHTTSTNQSLSLFLPLSPCLTMSLSLSLSVFA